MKRLFTAVFLGTLSVASAQQPAPVPPDITATAPTSLPAPEYSGVFYARNADKLVPLPHATPKVTRNSLVPGDVRPMEVGPTATLVVRIEGSGDPSVIIHLASVEGNKIPVKKGTLAEFGKTIDIVPRHLGNRVFEIRSSVPLPEGSYALALRGESVLNIPEVFLFRVTSRDSK